MDLKIKKEFSMVGARSSMDTPHANIKMFHYRGLPYPIMDLSKEQLLFLINELNQENHQLKNDIEDLTLEVAYLKGKVSEIMWQLDLD